MPEPSETDAREFCRAFDALQQEMEKVLVGQKEVIEGVLTAFFAGGHTLLEGAPGLARRCSCVRWATRRG